MTAYKTVALRTDRAPTPIKAALAATHRPDLHDIADLVDVFHQLFTDDVIELAGWFACDGTHQLKVWDRDPTVGRTNREGWVIPALSVACPVCGDVLEPTPSGALVCGEHGSEHFRCETDEPLLEALALAGLRAKQ